MAGLWGILKNYILCQISRDLQLSFNHSNQLLEFQRVRGERVIIHFENVLIVQAIALKRTLPPQYWISWDLQFSDFCPKSSLEEFYWSLTLLLIEGNKESRRVVPRSFHVRNYVKAFYTHFISTVWCWPGIISYTW